MWRNSVKDCQASNSFCLLNSDHRIVSTRMQLSLRSIKKVKAKSNLPHGWQLFKSDCSIKEAYTVEVNNRFEALYQDIENYTANEIYSALSEAHEEAAPKYVPKRKGKKKRVPWENEKIREKRKCLKTAHNQKRMAHQLPNTQKHLKKPRKISRMHTMKSGQLI